MIIHNSILKLTTNKIEADSAKRTYREFQKIRNK